MLLGDKILLERSQGRVSAFPKSILSRPGIGLELVEVLWHEAATVYTQRWGSLC